ncbi:MAG: hypothetical protein ACRC1Y_06430 [Paraclostridium sp.]
MRKLIDLLIYLLIFNILICLTLLLDIYSSKNDITQTSIEMSIANNDNYKLIEQILKDTNKKDLLKFIDYIDLNINQSIENDKNSYTSFSITLPQNKSFIALYKKNTDNTYTFFSLVDNLYHIDDFYFYNDFFIVEQSVINSANNANDKQFVDIFFNHGNMYISVLTKDIYKEFQISDNKDFKTIVSSSIDFLDDDIIKILYVSTYKTINYLSKVNNNENNAKSDKIIKEIYEWNPSLNKFEIINTEIIDKK